MARYTACFTTTGIVRVYNPFTQTSTPVSFSYLSGANSYERADKDARRVVAREVLRLPGAVGAPIFDSVITVRNLCEPRTNEGRVKLEGWNAPVASKEVTLTLTPAEAKTLLAVCYRIGGNPEGRRGHIDTIRKLLEAAGVEWRDYAGIGGALTLPSAPVGSVRKVG